MDISLPVEKDFDVNKLPKKTDLATILGGTESVNGFWLKHEALSDEVPVVMGNQTVCKVQKSDKAFIVPLIKASDVASLQALERSYAKASEIH